MNELTNERGFACPGLSLGGRLISIQYAKLLRTQDFIQALVFSQHPHRSAPRPLGPSVILQDPVVNILRLIHLSSQINCKIHQWDSSGLLYILITINYRAADLILRFCLNVKTLDTADCSRGLAKGKIQPLIKVSIYGLAPLCICIFAHRR